MPNSHNEQPRIHIAYTDSTEPLSPAAFEQYVSSLPPAHREQVLSYHIMHHAQNALLGKLLLLKALEQLALADLDIAHIRYTPHQRPHFGQAWIDFNISHSGNLVICAAATHMRVGIDVEEIRPIDLEEFQEHFSAPELADLTLDITNFHTLCTQKEAVMKANGKGLSLPAKDINISNNTSRIENETWHLTEIHVAPGYRCHLATNIPPPLPVTLKSYSF